MAFVIGLRNLLFKKKKTSHPLSTPRLKQQHISLAFPQTPKAPTYSHLSSFFVLCLGVQSSLQWYTVSEHPDAAHTAKTCI